MSVYTDALLLSGVGWALILFLFCVVLFSYLDLFQQTGEQLFRCLKERKNFQNLCAAQFFFIGGTKSFG